jgi:hypothetical protein
MPSSLELIGYTLIWDDVTYPPMGELMGWFMALTDYDYGI